MYSRNVSALQPYKIVEKKSLTVLQEYVYRPLSSNNGIDRYSNTQNCDRYKD